MSFAATMSRAWRPRPRLSAPTDTHIETPDDTNTIPHPLDGRDIELDPLVLTPPALSTSAPDPQPSPVRPTFTLGRSATTRARRTDDDGLGQYSLLTLLRAHPENLFAQPTALTPSLLASRALISLPAATVMAQTLTVVAMSLADPSVRARELGGISEAINRAEALVARLEARVHAQGAGQVTGPASPTGACGGTSTGTGTDTGMGAGTGSPGKDANVPQRQADDMPKAKGKSSIPRPVPKHLKSTPPKIPPSAWRDEAKETDKNPMTYGKKRSPRSSLSSLSTSPSSLSSPGTTPPKDTGMGTRSHSPDNVTKPPSPSPAARAKTPSPRAKSATPTSTPMTSPALLPTPPSPHSPSLSRFARDIVETRRHGFTLTRARVALECYPRWKGCAVTLMTEVRVAMARIQAIEREARHLGV